MQVAYGAGSIWSVALQNIDGSVPAVPTIAKLGVVQEWSMDIDRDLAQLFGTYQSPVAIAVGKTKYQGKMKFAQFNANFINSVLFGLPSNPATGETLMIEDLPEAVPASPYTFTPSVPGSGTFVADWGVRYQGSGQTPGLVLTKVASSPDEGQYSESDGTYTFAAADHSAAATVLISYEYTIDGGYTINVTNQLLGGVNTFQFFGKVLYDNAGVTYQLVLKFFSCVGSKISMQTKLDNFMIPEMDFMAFANAGNQVAIISMAEF